MIWLTSDTHFGHAKLIAGSKGMGLRCVNWPTVKEMDEALLDACNSVVGRKDTLYHLGDFAFADAARYRMAINCADVRFIWGNHDKPNVGQLFKYKWDTHTVMLGTSEHKRDTPCWLSHYPHAYWPKSHYGGLHLYGHMHGQREADLDAVYPDRRSMDVGVDNVHRLTGVPRPISEREVLNILMSRKGHDPVEFYRSEKES